MARSAEQERIDQPRHPTHLFRDPPSRSVPVARVIFPLSVIYINAQAVTNETENKEPLPSEHLVFEWMMDDTSRIDDLLCGGFYRENCEYVVDHFIQKLTESYLSFDQMPSSQCTLRDIKKATSSNDSYYSQLFTCDGNVFYLYFYPKYSGHPLIYIYVARALTGGYCSFIVKLKELELEKEKRVHLSNGSSEYELFSNSSFDNILKLDRLTIQLFKKVDSADASSISPPDVIKLPVGRYQWGFTNAAVGVMAGNDFMLSPLFEFGGFRWRLKLKQQYGRGHSPYVHLETMHADWYSSSKQSQSKDSIHEIRVFAIVFSQRADGNVQGLVATSCQFDYSTKSRQIGNLSSTQDQWLFLEFSIFQQYKGGANLSSSEIQESNHRWLTGCANTQPLVLRDRPEYTACFEWKIASEVLLTGFSRVYLADNMKAKIIETIKRFIHSAAETSIEDMRHGTDDTFFDSPVFFKSPFKLFLRLWPKHCGQFKVQVVALEDLQDVRWDFKLRLKENELEQVQDVIVKREHNNEFVFDREIDDLKQCTFELMYVPREKDKDAENRGAVQLPAVAFQWEIIDPEVMSGIHGASMNDYIASPQFEYGGVRWYVCTISSLSSF